MDVKKLIIDTVRNRLSNEGVKPDEIISLKLTFSNGNTDAEVITKNRGNFKEPINGKTNSLIKFIFISKINKICKKKLLKDFEKIILSINFESESFILLGVDIDKTTNKPIVNDITNIANIF